MQLFYTPEISEDTKAFVFSKEESKHITKVLRKKVDDELHITNGRGYLFTARITEVSPKQCKVVLTTQQKQLKRPYELHMAVAPTKMNDRYEWFLEKATEIGIDSITPIFCDHSERKVIKPERFEKIIQSAMKQSLNCYLPILHPAVEFKEYLKQNVSGLRFIAHCNPTEKHALKSEVRAKESVTLLIGPEGDFSDDEISLALETHFTPVSLGDSRLRTETAAIVGCHTVALVNQS